jgi:hypothetical protein
MTADPRILPPFSPPDEPAGDAANSDAPAAPFHEISSEQEERSTLAGPEPDATHLEPGSAAPILSDGLVSFPAAPPAPREVPNFGHTLLLFLMTAVFCFLAEVACVGVAMMFSAPHHRVHAQTLANDPRALVASQAVGYALTIMFASLIFSAWWHRPFFESIHWNWPIARKRAWWLMIVGLGLGFSMSLFGSLLPMPKDPPIVKDIMSNTAGAWYMFIFAVTGAPLFEEFAFRGFLLPSLINLSRWMGRRDLLPPPAVNLIGVPVSVVLTTLPFALLHSAQVSAAWGPLLLIAVVSVVLCAVRLGFNSVAASTLVHSAYNFTLFAGILVSTGGFRHLEKLAG